MFSRGEPTFSFLFKRGQINSTSFSPHCYLLHLSPRLPHNSQLALPFTLPARFSFSYITEANSAVKTKKKKKRSKEKKQPRLLPHQPGCAPLLVPPSLLPLLSPLHRGARRQKVAALITYCPIPHSKLVTIFTLVFSLLLFYHPANHTPSSYEQIICTKLYA